MDVQLSIAKVLEAQFGFDVKCLFRPNPNLFKSCSLLRARGSIMSQLFFNYYSVTLLGRWLLNVV